MTADADRLIGEDAEMVDLADLASGSPRKPTPTMKPMPSQKVTPAISVRLATLPAESPAGP